MIFELSKKYWNIIRFQKALSSIRNLKQCRCLMDIVFECGYFDHSQLSFYTISILA